MPLPSGLPLPTLLSQVLVAFTIEFDNEFERQMPHRTTRHGSTAGSRQGPWLVSLVMWSNCMRFVGEAGVPVGELEALARTPANLNGMKRWGYIVVEPGSVIRATPKGRKAQEVWGPLFEDIENRWQERFGKDAIGQLRESLWALTSQFDIDLPDCLPILGYRLFSRGPDPKRRAPAVREDRIASRLALPALLSKALLAFAIEFERESDLSLAISANVVRVLDRKGVAVRDLPLLTGVSKEAIATALGVLQKSGVAAVERGPDGSRAKVVRLTPKGREAKDAYRRLLGTVEERWQARFGKDAIRVLRESLERLVGEPAAPKPPLFRGLDLYPEGWRASVRKPNTLPHYPMVLHRGGFPDGS
jgi:DNA-binding MarR family transcriptional regulator